LYLFVQVEEWIPVQDIALLKSAEWAQGWVNRVSTVTFWRTVHHAGGWRRRGWSQMPKTAKFQRLSSGSGSWASNETSYVLVFPNYYSVKWEITYSP
jgi:hypothetical protein